MTDILGSLDALFSVVADLLEKIAVLLYTRNSKRVGASSDGVHQAIVDNFFVVFEFTSTIAIVSLAFHGFHNKRLGFRVNVHRRSFEILDMLVDLLKVR